MDVRTQQTDAVFRALSSPIRRLLIDTIRRHPGSSLNDVADNVDGTRQAVRKHIAVLAEATLVHVMDDGRTKRVYYNPVPLQELYDRWSDERSTVLAREILRIRDAVEKRKDD